MSVTIDNIPSNRWNHVHGIKNPADCASRGLFPNELVSHQLWWQGPSWLGSQSLNWPVQSVLSPTMLREEEREIFVTASTIFSSDVPSHSDQIFYLL